MDPEEPQRPQRRKVKFAPKAVPRKRPNPSSSSSSTTTTTPRITEASDRDDDEAQILLRRFNESRARGGTSADKKSTVQVAFGPGAPASSSIQSWGKKSSIEQNDSPDDAEIILTSTATATATATAITDGVNFDDTSNQKDNQKDEDKYTEPWDYDHAYYPTILPWRRPYSGDPELLNEAEFGEAARKMEYDENSVNPASYLGLLEGTEEQKMLFFKLPSSFPLVKRSASVKGKEVIGKFSSSNTDSPPKKGCNLEELPGGYMGKMLVYKSGAVKLKLGETLFDVSPGTDRKFAQYIAAINTADKHCCMLGEVGKHAVITPDIDSLLNSGLDLG